MRYRFPKDLSRAQLLGGAVRLSEQGKGKSLSGIQRDFGAVRLSQLGEVEETVTDQLGDKFEKTGRGR